MGFLETLSVRAAIITFLGEGLEPVPETGHRALSHWWGTMLGLSHVGRKVQTWYHLGCPSPVPICIWQQSALANHEAAQELVMGEGQA